MHFLILFISLLTLSQLDGRPSPSEDNESANKEMECQGENDPEAEEYVHDEQSQQMAEDREEIPRNAHQESKDDFIKSEDKRAAQHRLAANKFSDLKSGREINEENDQNINFEDNVAIPTNGQHMNIYRETYETDNNNQPMKVLSLAAQNMYNPQDHEEVDPNQNEINYQPVDGEVGEILFKNRRSHKEPNNYQYKHESQYMENQRIPNREYYNAIQLNKRMGVEKRYDNSPKIERDRRQIQKSRDNVNDTPNENESNVAGAVEDNEAAIKNKIKKLSKEEFEDLLNSLTEDKKTLLKKVINDKDLPNKREITKKAGAIEENNIIENGQVDTRNSQGECVTGADTDSSTSQNNDVITTSNENNDTPSTKPSDDKNPDKLDNNVELVDKNLKSDIDLRNTNVDVKNVDNLNDNSKVPVKNENKREIDLNNQDRVNLNDDKLNAASPGEYRDSLSNQNGIYNNEEYADLMNSESLPDIKSVNKRENEEEMSFDNAESFKCLQDSFPSENEKSNLKSDLVPLIRVKRTDLDHSDKKRDTNIMANIKVPFFPDAENENLDNDERSEFEDYGIFDRKTHLPRNEQFEDSDKSKIETFRRRQPNLKTNEDHSCEDSSKIQNVKSDMDNMNLGSDTDSVLTGAEGSDENIMFNSGLRNQRAVDNSKIPENKYLARFERTVEPLEIDPVVENNVNIQEYKEDETVGAQPHANEGDVSRYKRIRDAKQNLG